MVCLVISGKTIRRLEQMMINRFQRLKHQCAAWIVSVLMLLVAGCVTLPDPANEIDTSAYSNVTSVQAVKELESNLKDSASKELNVFAPKHFITADKALIEARSLISKNQPREKVVQKVAVAEAVLKNGDLVMRKVKDILEEQLVVKEKLESLETPKVYRSEYGSLVERLNTIIREIESGDVNSSEKNRGKLLHDLQKLERRSIRYNAMHEPEEILKRVKYRGGEKLAPLTYQDAVAVFKRAEEFITQNPNYESGIEQMGQEALFAAKRALYITEQVAALSQKVSLSLEQVVLDEEYRLYRVARELASIDLRDNPLEVQSELLAETAKNKSKEYQNKEELIIALRDTLIKVRDSSTQLAELNDTSNKLRKEKGEWLAKEALYKAKVSHLEENLTQSEIQLDQTQQKLLAIKDENNLLFNQLSLEKENSQTLENQLQQTNVTATKTSPQQNMTTDPAAVEHEIPNTEPAAQQEIVAIPTTPNLETTPSEPVQTENQIADSENPTGPTPTVDIKESDLDTSGEVAEQPPTPAKTEEIAIPQGEIENSQPEVAETIANETDIKPQSPTDSNSAAVNKEKEKPNTESAKAELIMPESVAAQEPAIKDEIEKTVSTTDNKENPESEKIQKVAITTLPTSDKPRAKITEKETLDALNSVKELIKLYEKTEEKPAGKTAQNSPSVKTTTTKVSLKDKQQNATSDDSDDDIFVDASE